MTPRKKSQVTLQDIADKLKVTKVTISKALRDHPDISEQRIQDVKRTAEQMGYFPNFAARNLSAKKSNTIGLIVPVIANSFFAEISEAIYNSAFKNNYDIILAVSQEDSERERKHLETMLSMIVDGLIVSVSEHTKNLDLFNKIREMGTPIVFFDRTIDGPNFSSVTHDNKQISFNAVEYAIKQGYKKIGHIGGWQNINIGRDRYAGFAEAMNKYNLPINSDWVFFSGFGKEDGYESLMEMYRNGKLPDFIFAVTYPVALGIYEAANELGLKIPNDLDLICFGNSDINDYLKPTLSYIDHKTKDVGEKSFELILNHINEQKPFKPKNIEIGTSIIIKETCIKRV